MATTSPVTSITDELLAEIEAADSTAYYPASDMQIIVARLRAAEQDSARLDWYINQCCVMECMNGMGSPLIYRLCWPQEGEHQTEWYSSREAAIDAAMQQEAKP